MNCTEKKLVCIKINAAQADLNWKIEWIVKLFVGKIQLENKILIPDYYWFFLQRTVPITKVIAILHLYAPLF